MAGRDGVKDKIFENLSTNTAGGYFWVPNLQHLRNYAGVIKQNLRNVNLSK